MGTQDFKNDRNTLSVFFMLHNYFKRCKRDVHRMGNGYRYVGELLEENSKESPWFVKVVAVDGGAP